MDAGKKHVVISQEEYQRLLRNKSIAPTQPEQHDMHKSEQEMKSVWERNLPEDEKIRLFMEELTNFKTRYDSLLKPKPLEVIMNKRDEKDKEKVKPLAVEKNQRDLTKEYSAVHDVIHSLPKASQKHGELLLHHLQSRPDVVT